MFIWMRRSGNKQRKTTEVKYSNYSHLANKSSFVFGFLFLADLFPNNFLFYFFFYKILKKFHLLFLFKKSMALKLYESNSWHTLKEKTNFH